MTAAPVISTVVDAVALRLPPGWVGWDYTLVPPSPLDTYGYPIERVRVVVEATAMRPKGLLTFVSSAGLPRERATPEVHAYPLDGWSRTWRHRNPDGDLCLWYPDDPPTIRWTVSEGLPALLLLIQRHLIAEEGCRRGLDWPVEDAPHGRPVNGGAHPIRSASMLAAAS